MHASRYRISSTRWTPGKFSSVHQRIVTCPWMRQSFSLLQCSVQHPSLCLQHVLPVPSCKTCYQQTFSAWKNGPSCGLSFKHFQSYFSSWILSSNSKIYLSFPPLSSCWSVKTIWISKKWKTTTLDMFFFFRAEMDLQKPFPGKRIHKSLHLFRHTSETNRKALLIGISAILLTSLFEERNTENILSLLHKLMSTNINELLSR